MARTLIIGIGNPMRGDDALGWRAIEELNQAFSCEEAEMVTCHQLTPDLAESVAQRESVIFIDACAGSPPGEIRVNQLTTRNVGPTPSLRSEPALSTAKGQALGSALAGASPGPTSATRGLTAAFALTHRLDPLSLMQYSRALYGICPQAWTISMNGADYGYSEALSFPVESRLPELIALAAQAVLRGTACLEERIGVQANG